MNRSELIAKLAEEVDLSPKEAAEVVNTITNTMAETLVAGDNIEIRGFGSFVVKEYKSYEGRNPKTGKKITVQEKKLPFFKVGKDLKEKVNVQ